MQVRSGTTVLIMFLRAEPCQGTQMFSFCSITENKLEIISLLRQLTIPKESWETQIPKGTMLQKGL